jgi:hypothetical protein
MRKLQLASELLFSSTQVPKLPFLPTEEIMNRSTRSAVWTVAVALLVAVVVVVPGRADDKPKPKDEPKPKKKLTVMQRKLMYAEKVLEGLAVNDFAKIDTAADGLIACVKDETWKINETEKYMAHTNDFMRRVQSLKKAAKDKNIDAAALSYVDMTLTCVRCHEYLRESNTRAVPDLTQLARKR